MRTNTNRDKVETDVLLTTKKTLLIPVAAPNAPRLGAKGAERGVVRPRGCRILPRARLAITRWLPRFRDDPAKHPEQLAQWLIPAA